MKGKKREEKNLKRRRKRRKGLLNLNGEIRYEFVPFVVKNGVKKTCPTYISSCV